MRRLQQNRRIALPDQDFCLRVATCDGVGDLPGMKDVALKSASLMLLKTEPMVMALVSTLPSPTQNMVSEQRPGYGHELNKSGLSHFSTS